MDDDSPLCEGLGDPLIDWDETRQEATDVKPA